MAIGRDAVLMLPIITRAATTEIKERTNRKFSRDMSLTSQRRRKIISKVLMIVLSILAVLVIVACVLVSVM